MPISWDHNIKLFFQPLTYIESMNEKFLTMMRKVKCDQEQFMIHFNMETCIVL